MRIWIDMANAPHVLFFEEFIRIWQADGHEVFVTARDQSNTLDLLTRLGIPYKEVGRHYGKKAGAKLLGFPIRCWQLFRALRRRGIDVGISQSSYYSPIVCRLLGVPGIYTNDNEFAKGNLPAFLFASRLILPACLKSWARGSAVLNWQARRNRLSFYPGIKEAIYLHRQASPQTKNDVARPTIFFRPESWTAHYHKEKIDAFNTLLARLGEHYDVHLLPRSAEQRLYFSEHAFPGVHVVEGVMVLPEIAAKCDVFIGAGGTMNREFALLGIPTISIYRGPSLAADEELVSRGLMYRLTDLDPAEVEGLIQKCLSEPRPGREFLDLSGAAAFEMVREAPALACQRPGRVSDSAALQ